MLQTAKLASVVRPSKIKVCQGPERSEMYLISVPIPHKRPPWAEYVLQAAPGTEPDDPVFKYGEKVQPLRRPAGGKITLALVSPYGIELETTHDAVRFGIRHGFHAAGAHHLFDMLVDLGDFHRKVEWPLGRGPGIMTTEPLFVSAGQVEWGIAAWHPNRITPPKAKMKSHAYPLADQTLYLFVVQP